MLLGSVHLGEIPERSYHDGSTHTLGTATAATWAILPTGRSYDRQVKNPYHAEQGDTTESPTAAIRIGRVNFRL